MISQEEVFIWFKDLEGHSRIELMCALLDSCLPLELRFLGTYLEYAAGKHYTHLQKWEKDANVSSSLFSATNLSDTKIRRRLCIFLALLHSHNREVAMKLFGILSMYECFATFDNSENTGPIDGDNDNANSANSDFDWSEITSRNEMRLLLTMASLHPAFDFDQRQNLRKKMEKFNSKCKSYEFRDEEIVSQTDAEIIRDSCETLASSIASTTEVTSTVTTVYSSEQGSVTKSPLLPSPQAPRSELRYPLLKPFPYTVPIATPFPPQPLRQILIPRQPIPIMNHHDSVPVLSQHTNSVLEQAQFIPNVTSLPITHPVVVPTSLDLKNLIVPPVYSLPTLPIPTSDIDLISFNSQHMADQKPVDNSLEMKIRDIASNEYKSKELDKNCISCASHPVVHNSYPVNHINFNKSLHDIRTDIKTIPSTNSSVYPIVKETPRRCYSESDTDTIPFSEMSALLRNPSEFHVPSTRIHHSVIPYSHVGHSSVPLYVTFPPHNSVSDNSVQNIPSSIHSRTSPTTFRTVNPVDAVQQNFQMAVTNVSATSYHVHEPVTTQLNHTKIYVSGGNDIMHSGINGGFIHTHPVIIPVTSNGTKPTLYSKEKVPDAHSDFSYLRSMSNPVKHSPADTSISTSMSDTTLNITSGDMSDSPCVSPTPSPRMFTSPMHSPSSHRKSYAHYKENAMVFSSAADWLKSLRLHKYSSKFEGFTFQMMQNLTDQDLEALSLTVGARRKFKQCVEYLVKRGFKEFGNHDNALLQEASFPGVPPPEGSPNSKSGKSSEHLHNDVTTHHSTTPSATSPLHNPISSNPPSHQLTTAYMSPNDVPASSLPPSPYHQSEKKEGRSISSFKLTGYGDNSGMPVNDLVEEDEKLLRKRVKDATCYNCGLAGHYGDDCSEQTMEALTYSRYAFHLDFSNHDKSSTEPNSDVTTSR